MIFPTSSHVWILDDGHGAPVVFRYPELLQFPAVAGPAQLNLEVIESPWKSSCHGGTHRIHIWDEKLHIYLP